MKLEVKAVRHKDVKGKEQLYVVIGESNEIVMNVGVGTIEKLEKLIFSSVIPDEIGEKSIIVKTKEKN